ncbi:Uncharacterised protein [Vibrio cholerae]|nr:Uncharacterised protein [Vibrio cholerae]
MPAKIQDMRRRLPSSTSILPSAVLRPTAGYCCPRSRNVVRTSAKACSVKNACSRAF